ncbi:MAG: hypothetical protein K0S53_444 [Bacteroidetes bacterium]|jgi:hypothetical protein|nr:hypothetical protein [Bacteroidota bacterium]MDF2453808.1 hypothetical protein [Bacteroidota bacterium]
MNKTIATFILSVIIFFNCLTGTSQTYSDDSQLWAHFKLTKEITKKLDITLKLQARLKNDASELGRASSNLRISYKVHKNIKLLAGYSFIEKRNKDDIFRTRHSYYGAIELKKDIRRFEFSYRNLFMCRYKNPFTSYDGYIAYLYDRNRITIKYEQSKRVSFYVREDINIPLNNPQLTGISRARTFLGTDINVSKHQKIEAYLMYHLQLQQGDWYDQDISYTINPLDRYFVFGIGYAIEF